MRINSWEHKRREENQLDATEWFIALEICSTCFGNLYAHHQELETILVLLPHMVCVALVAGGDDGHISARNMLSRLQVQINHFSSI